MNLGLNLDFNKVGFWHWFIFAGIGIIIFSIIYNPDYVFLGFSTMTYGAISFFLDLALDRIISKIIGENLTIDKVYKIPWYWHLARLVAHITPLIIYVIAISVKYGYF